MNEEFESHYEKEDFGSYSDLQGFFIFCIHTCGFSKKDIANALDLSPTGLSIRMNEADNGDHPRFTLNHLQKYMMLTKDTRIRRYIVWLDSVLSELPTEKKRRADKELRDLYFRMKKYTDEMKKYFEE
jgi:hypothetical protein